jgi:hypothetical protein
MEPIRFTGRVRHWNEEKGVGLAVVDLPQHAITALGGLRQQRVGGTINDTPFTSSVMAAGHGRLAMSVSKALLKAAGSAVGEELRVEITAVGRG